LNNYQEKVTGFQIPTSIKPVLISRLPFAAENKIRRDNLLTEALPDSDPKIEDF